MKIMRRRTLVGVSDSGRFIYALIASGALHLLSFITLGLLINWLSLFIETAQPVFLDFIFMPQDVEREAGRTNTGAVLKKAIASGESDPHSDMASEKVPDHIRQNEQRRRESEALKNGAKSQARTPEIFPLTKEDIEKTAQDVHAGSLEKTMPVADVDLNRKSIIPAIAPQKYRSVNNRYARQLKTQPALLSIAPDVRKMLRSKFRKWTENFHEMKLPDSTLTWKRRGKTYTAKFERRPAKLNTGLDEVHVSVSTEGDGMELKTEMRMKRLAFSNYAQFVDSWDPQVAVHDDELTGRFHANSKINISISGKVKPKFNGKVTTASYKVNSGSRFPFFNKKAIFPNGLETGVKVIRLPRALAPFAADTTLSPEQILEFREHAYITFYTDGTYSWRTIGDELQTGHGAVSEKPFYVIGHKRRRLHIQGCVKGKVLVYSPGNIVIDDDLTYASNPENAQLSEDFLGIISDRNVVIAKSSGAGADNLEIYAAIFARNRFIVENIYSKNHGIMHIYGSLTAGTMSATEPRYATRVRFDKRLEQRRPPNFPMTNRYEVSDWEPNWKIGATDK